MITPMIKATYDGTHYANGICPHTFNIYYNDYPDGSRWYIATYSHDAYTLKDNNTMEIASPIHSGEEYYIEEDKCYTPEGWDKLVDLLHEEHNHYKSINKLQGE